MLHTKRHVLASELPAHDILSTKLSTTQLENYELFPTC